MKRQFLLDIYCFIPGSVCGECLVRGSSRSSQDPGPHSCFVELIIKSQFNPSIQTEFDARLRVLNIQLLSKQLWALITQRIWRVYSVDWDEATPGCNENRFVEM